ncbi:Hypothetical predicted protein [Olea europaea subsp. europaea]|uniref:Uncharacterized protein n=1 Tax=Olea europaea subsp. europaea TaxID=158383 RepID=A0A8S0PEN4_OLEEU|nr:Hypothetical predicted protein [Olea europaea subsp. europaea]
MTYVKSLRTKRAIVRKYAGNVEPQTMAIPATAPAPSSILRLKQSFKISISHHAHISSTHLQHHQRSLEEEAERKIGWMLKLLFAGTATIVAYQFFPYLGDNLMQQSVSLLHVKDPLFKRMGEVAWRQRWTVHRGVGSEESNLLYTVEQSQSLQFKTQLSVFLATSLTGEIRDFCVVGSYVSQSFKVYKGDTLIAEVKQRFNLGSLGKEKFEARVYPGVDYAFIVSLLVILNEIDS